MNKIDELILSSKSPSHHFPFNKKSSISLTNSLRWKRSWKQERSNTNITVESCWISNLKALIAKNLNYD